MVRIRSLETALHAPHASMGRFRTEVHYALLASLANFGIDPFWNVRYAPTVPIPTAGLKHALRLRDHRHVDLDKCGFLKNRNALCAQVEHFRVELSSLARHVSRISFGTVLILRAKIASKELFQMDRHLNVRHVDLGKCGIPTKRNAICV